VTGEPFLHRWSRRKHAVARDAAMAPAAPNDEHAVARSEPAVSSPVGNVASADPPPPLPPVESLTFESDFRAFLEPHVGENLKRQALRKLLHDPRFNVMDGLDVYIDDYSVPSPLEPDVMRGLAQARYIFEPPQTRVNAAGHVEDVPPAEPQPQADARADEAPQASDILAPADATPIRASADPESDADGRAARSTPPDEAGAEGDTPR
jgi:hypothetical protein